MSILLFVVILVVLVLVHEFGHFIVAKAGGIRVDEFGVGFPPRVWGKKVGETLYSVNALPFGGFVKIFGEDPNDESIRGPDSRRSFVHKPRILQAAVLVAGVFFNVLFAWILLSSGFLIGLPTSLSEEFRPYAQNVRVIVTAVAPAGPALKAEIKPGDTIVAIRDSRSNVALEDVTPEGIKKFVSAREGNPLQLTLSREGVMIEKSVTPVLGISENPAIGIGMDEVGDVKLPVVPAFIEGGKLTYDIGKATAGGLFNLVREAFVGKADLSQISGPVGIVGLVGEASRLGFIYILTFTALISINLAVINLLPFPALDGGRLLFVIIEGIIRRPISPAIANAVNYAGFAILIGLMVIVTYHDIVKLIAS